MICWHSLNIRNDLWKRSLTEALRKRIYQRIHKILKLSANSNFHCLTFYFPWLDSFSSSISCHRQIPRKNWNFQSKNVSSLLKQTKLGPQWAFCKIVPSSDCFLNSKLESIPIYCSGQIWFVSCKMNFHHKHITSWTTMGNCQKFRYSNLQILSKRTSGNTKQSFPKTTRGVFRTH